MSNITSDTQAIDALVQYTRTFGVAKGWPESIIAELQSNIEEIGKDWIDSYGDSLNYVITYPGSDLSGWSDYLTVAKRYAEELGSDYDVSAWDVAFGTASGIASDVADVSETARDAAVDLTETATDHPWLIPLVVAGIVGAFWYVKGKIL